MADSTLVQITRDPAFLLIEFPGELTHLDERVIDTISRELVEAAESAPAGRMVLNLGSVEFFGSSFIEALFRAWNRLNRQEKGRLVLASVRPYCREVLEVTHLDRLWPIEETLESARLRITAD